VIVREPNDQTWDAVKFEEVIFVANTFPIVPAFVSVDVATFHTSAASVPNDVKVREADDQTARGIVAASDVEAVKTVAFVFALIVEIAEVICEFVFALTLAVPAEIAAANDDDALFTSLSVSALVAAVPAEIAAANDVEAVSTVALVLALIVVIAAAICELVFELIAAARGVVEAWTYPMRNERSSLI